MSYRVKRINENEICVISETHTFMDTKREYWYIKTDTWERTLTGDPTDTRYYPMDEDSIAWAKRNYVPKARVYGCNCCDETGALDEMYFIFNMSDTIGCECKDCFNTSLSKGMIRTITPVVVKGIPVNYRYNL